LAVYFRLIGKQGEPAQSKANYDARTRLAEKATEGVKSAVAAYQAERGETIDTIRDSLNLVRRANARLS
jgi:hypothetical protein